MVVDFELARGQVQVHAGCFAWRRLGGCRDGRGGGGLAQRECAFGFRLFNFCIFLHFLEVIGPGVFPLAVWSRLVRLVAILARLSTRLDLERTPFIKHHIYDALCNFTLHVASA